MSQWLIIVLEPCWNLDFFVSPTPCQAHLQRQDRIPVRLLGDVSRRADFKMGCKESEQCPKIDMISLALASLLTLGIYTAQMMMKVLQILHGFDHVLKLSSTAWLVQDTFECCYQRPRERKHLVEGCRAYYADEACGLLRVIASKTSSLTK